MNKQDAITLIKEIEKQYYKPSQYEHTFMATIKLWRGEHITTKQAKFLQGIYERATV